MIMLTKKRIENQLCCKIVKQHTENVAKLEDEINRLIPEEIFIECIKSINNGDFQAEGICPECGKMVKFKYYPYKWDPCNSTVTYMGICPECGKPFYIYD